MNTDVDCFGFLFDESLIVCREKCELRIPCKQSVQENLKKNNDHSALFENKSALLVNQAASQNKPQKNKQPTSVFIDPKKLSQTVHQVIKLCESLGLKTVFKKYYLVFKDKSQHSLLHISRFQSEKLSGLVRFVRFVDRKSFPDPVQKFISHEKCCGQHYFVGQNIKELELVLKAYLKQVGFVFHQSEACHL